MPAAPSAVEESREYTGDRFDLQSYLARSKQLDLSGIDFEDAKNHPVDPGEIRSLKYMMDIESHTLCYLQSVLNAGAGADPEIADFLGCWLYEESYHGRAIERFVKAVGHDLSMNVCGRHTPTLLERLEAFGSGLVARLFPREFLTTYMTWGSIQEHSTLFGYTNMARKTRNPVLAELLRRIAREESRHFGFYYYKAFQGLKNNPFQQRFTAFLLKNFWTPVGEGVKPRSETDFLLTYIFDGEDGKDAMARIDRSMQRLPGLSWFNLMTGRCGAAFERAALGLIPAIPAP